MAAATAPVLDLTTLEPMHVRIDGESYAIKTPNALSIRDIKHIESEWPRMGALLEQDRFSDDEVTELSARLDSACRLILDAPVEVHGRLGDQQRMEIVTVFSRLRLTQMATNAGAKVVRLTGVNTSRGSSASTVATRRAGTRASR